VKGFYFESVFTQLEYKRFAAAVERRDNYMFRYGKNKDKLQIAICGRRCANGVWSPEDYYWSIDTQDRRDGFRGGSDTFRVGGLKPYADIIDLVYDKFKLPRPAGFQQSFL